MTTLWKSVPLVGLLGACPVGAASLTLAPVDDASVYNVAPTTNDGSGPGLSSGDLVSGHTQHRWTSFLKFDLSAIPDNLTITGATLHLYQANGAGYIRTTGTNAAHVADDSWSEATLTWNNQPAAGAILGTNPDTADHRGWSQWDLLATGVWDASVDQADDLLSLAVTEVPGSSSHNWCSKESDLLNCLAPGEAGPAGSLRRPYLEITAVPLPAAVWLFGSGLVGLLGLARRGKV
ncbi:MAG TPA: DNRLRE domain-containing protein [Thiohalobacter sp.]|nr:DNRLRE domain-containing protein [Thiohalobacter sp.]